MIDAEIKEWADARYVLRDDCDDKHKAVEERLADGSIKFAIINTKLTAITWIGGIIAGAVIAELLARIFRLI